MKIFCFGIGEFYKKRRRLFFRLSREDTLCGYIDNRADEIIECDGLTVYLPSKALQVKFDAIILMSASYREMREQLLLLGVPAVKILFWEEYLALKSRGKLQIFTNDFNMSKEKRILLLTNDLGYHGGSIASVNAAKCLAERGYAVVVAAASTNDAFVGEIVSDGINVIVAPSIPYIGVEELFWINLFDVVVVNTFTMIQCAVEIARIKPVLWWVHEARDVYEDVRYRFSRYDVLPSIQRVDIYAVSETARRNFERYYPN